MCKKIAILQSNYIPWKGYFDLIAAVDEFIFLDEVQYTKNDWRNRNQIKTKNGLLWLTVPVYIKSLSQKICETEVADNIWKIKHYKSLCNCYSKAQYFKEIIELLEPLYTKDFKLLSEINYSFIEQICNYLDIKTKLSFSVQYELENDKIKRLLSLCKQTNATEYISGPSAKSYINELLFKEANINLIWFDYSNYPNYPQLHPPFEHHVSILDLLFNCGKNSKQYMKAHNA